MYYATSIKATFPLKHKNTTILFEILVVLAMTRGAIKHISAKVGRQDLRKRVLIEGKKTKRFREESMNLLLCGEAYIEEM